MPIISSGVVYVILDNPNEERPDFKGFADFYGNDTFSESVLNKVRNNPRRQRVEEVVEEVEEDIEEVYDDEPEAPAKAVPARKSNAGFVPPTLNYSNEETGVGTLTVYRFKNTINQGHTQYQDVNKQIVFDRSTFKGDLLCDNNYPGAEVSSTIFNGQSGYQYYNNWDNTHENGMFYTYDIETTSYKFDELLTEEVGEYGMTFVTEDGMKSVSIFKYKPNGYDIDGGDEPDYIIWGTVPKINSGKGSKGINFIASLEQEGQHVKLYTKNANNAYCGTVFENLRSSSAKPFDAQGNMQTNLWSVNSKNFISIAYVRKNHALYVNGIWYYLKTR